MTKKPDELTRLRRVVADQQKALKRKNAKIRKLNAQRTASKGKELRKRITSLNSTIAQLADEKYKLMKENQDLSILRWFWCNAIGYYGSLEHEDARKLDLD